MTKEKITIEVDGPSYYIFTINNDSRKEHGQNGTVNNKEWKLSQFF
jgi:hypothetical protein